MDTTKTARVFLACNALFSALVGLDLLLFTDIATSLLFTGTDSWQSFALQVLGIGLLLFAADLIFMARNRNISAKPVKMIVAMDSGWIAASALLLLLTPATFTTTGQFILIVISAFVAIFAWGQYTGANKIAPT